MSRVFITGSSDGLGLMAAHHQNLSRVNPDAQQTDVQDELLAYCADLTGVSLPD